MSRQIRNEEILFYYDGIQLFLGVDQFDTHYICVLVECTYDEDKFLCAPVSDSRLNSFYEGHFDLRDIFTQLESDDLYTITVTNYSLGEFFLQSLEIQQVPEEWLPESGFFLAKTETSQEENSIVTESKDKGRAIIHLSLNPPEAREYHRINVDHLSNTLTVYQNLVKHAYQRATRGREKDLGEALRDVNQFKLQAFTFSPGSFQLHLQTKSTSDMLGYVDIAKGLKLIDEITDNLSVSQDIPTVMQQYKGHLARAYLRFIELIVRQDSPIYYQWTIPEYASPINKRISRDQAGQWFDVLSKLENLGRETIEIIGNLTKVDVARRSWTLYSDLDKKSYGGTIPKNSNISLSGAVIDTQIYRFICEEEIEEVVGTGQEKTHLILLAYEPVG